MSVAAFVNNEIDKHWYVVYTKPRWEKKVAELLTNARIENYCPLNKVTRQWSDREKIVSEPFFKSYVFVRVSEDQKWKVPGIPGIVSYIYWLSKPAIVPAAEIEQIKCFLHTYDNVFIRQVNIAAGHKIKVTSGAFRNMQGTVVSLKGKQIQVEIPSLNIALIAMSTDNVEVVL
ncbi:transcription antitermination factor NusG [Mucilaginibacter frigoritolerans]|uniref:Transcription antitermination factor NusG n=1 Tax=Mucilaginibacter frigoritolerans TaxID=652788 RepID=A0A562U4R8_9SPHI|nr:UpxY family transcription antiterminator [Mucilaginibacter frigoritolerans]TWJ00800.1 transcription antitermination factor NusG [Mucilaginibacter frigoritolerans]